MDHWKTWWGRNGCLQSGGSSQGGAGQGESLCMSTGDACGGRRERHTPMGTAAANEAPKNCRRVLPYLFVMDPPYFYTQSD